MSAESEKAEVELAKGRSTTTHEAELVWVAQAQA